MKRLICLFLLFLFSPLYVFATQFSFYDSSSGIHIIDVSGKKSKSQIAEEFGINELTLQGVVVEEDAESVYLDSGILKKKNYKNKQNQANANKKANKKVKKSLIKTKLGFSESDWKNLLEALGQ